MVRRVIAVVAALLLGGLVAAARGEEKPRLAVLNFAQQGAKQEAEAVTEEVRQAFVNSGKFVVIDRTLTDQILKEWELQQSGLTGREKAIKIGKLFNVQVIVTGKLNRFASGGWQVSAAMLEAQTGVTRKAETVRHRGEFFALLDTKVPALAAGLLGQPPPKPVPEAMPKQPNREGHPGSKKLAIFPASLGDARGSKFRKINGKLLKAIQRVLDAHLDRAYPTHTYYPLESFPLAQLFGHRSKGLPQRMWAGVSSVKPDAEPVFRVAEKLRIDLVLMYESRVEKDGSRTYGVYLLERESRKIRSRTGTWAPGGWGAWPRTVAQAVAGLIREIPKETN